MQHDRINLGRRKQEGTPKCQINLRNRKARIASAMTWLDDHGRESKKPRPEGEIETKEYDIARFGEIKVAYVKALNRKLASEAAA